MTQIAFLLYDDMTALDAVGPYEVLAYRTRSHPDDGYDLSRTRPSRRPV